MIRLRIIDSPLSNTVNFKIIKMSKLFVNKIVTIIVAESDLKPSDILVEVNNRLTYTEMDLVAYEGRMLCIQVTSYPSLIPYDQMSYTIYRNDIAFDYIAEVKKLEKEWNSKLTNEQIENGYFFQIVLSNGRDLI